MGIYYFGEILKRYRESLGMTQEVLSEGICSNQTLSRIENGRQKAGITARQQLMERMGKENRRVYALMPITDAQAQAYVRDYEEALGKCDYKAADKLLGKMEKAFADMAVKRQYILGGQAFVGWKLQRITAEEGRALFWEALKLSVPDPARQSISQYPWLSHELWLLLGIADCYYGEGKCQEAISLLEGMKKGLDSGYRIPERGQRMELIVRERLMDAYGQLSQHRMAIKCAEEGIAVSRQEKSSEYLVQFLEGRAQYMGRLLAEEEAGEFIQEDYKEALRQAAIIAAALGKRKQKKRMEKQFKEAFGEKVWL